MIYRTVRHPCRFRIDRRGCNRMWWSVRAGEGSGVTAKRRSSLPSLNHPRSQSIDCVRSRVCKQIGKVTVPRFQPGPTRSSPAPSKRKKNGGRTRMIGPTPFLGISRDSTHRRSGGWPGEESADRHVCRAPIKGSGPLQNSDASTCVISSGATRSGTEGGCDVYLAEPTGPRRMVAAVDRIISPHESPQK